MPTGTEEMRADAPPLTGGGDGGVPDFAVETLGQDHCRVAVVIVNEMGLHARPASEFVKLAGSYACGVSIRKGNQQVDGKSILQLFSLAAEVGTRLTLEGRGPDAHAALVALAELVRSGFREQDGG
jgi:phosphotransferase system HPr (HPr) family protein